MNGYKMVLLNHVHLLMLAKSSSPQKDGSPRVCIDFRKLNRVLVKDHYPLPLIEDILDKLQDTRVFSTIDLRNGFSMCLLTNRVAHIPPL
ncbi:hypothetical protein TNCV_4750861 [Trichonephila clavipes]|nr:hypothetical protein TNCV_4750861 [Trichonephila clavipes]